MIHFKKIGYNHVLKDAGHNLYQVHGEGYLKVNKSLANSFYYLIHKWYTPYMTVLVISSGEVFQRHRKTNRSHTTHSDLFPELVMSDYRVKNRGTIISYIHPMIMIGIINYPYLLLNKPWKFKPRLCIH